MRAHTYAHTIRNNKYRREKRIKFENRKKMKRKDESRNTEIRNERFKRKRKN